MCGSRRAPGGACVLQALRCTLATGSHGFHFEIEKAPMARTVLPIAGAIIGSFVPGVGTAVGYAIGHATGHPEMWCRDEFAENPPQQLERFNVHSELLDV